jgi:hypothetical protein
MRRPSRELLAEIVCVGKVRHESRRLALEALKVQMRCLDYGKRDREPMNVYRCDICKGFHVGRNRVWEGDDNHRRNPKQEPKPGRGNDDDVHEG